jgi:hypothetical protein
VDESIALFEQVLSDRRLVLGDDHPDTRNSRFLLGGTYQLRNAVALLKQVRIDPGRVLGDDHPTTPTVAPGLGQASDKQQTDQP